jgi:hypothetical protein
MVKHKLVKHTPKRSDDQTLLTLSISKELKARIVLLAALRAGLRQVSPMLIEILQEPIYNACSERGVSEALVADCLAAGIKTKGMKIKWPPAR